MRRRVSSLTSGLPRRARDTVDWETPARWAMSKEVALPFFCTWRDLLLVRRTQGPGQAGMLAALGLRRLFAGGKKKAPRVRGEPSGRGCGSQGKVRLADGSSREVVSRGRRCVRPCL